MNNQCHGCKRSFEDPEGPKVKYQLLGKEYCPHCARQWSVESKFVIDNPKTKKIRIRTSPPELVEKARKILGVLEKQKFADWYNGRFESWLTAEYPVTDPKHISHEDILEEVISVFHLGE